MSSLKRKSEHERSSLLTPHQLHSVADYSGPFLAHSGDGSEEDFVDAVGVDHGCTALYFCLCLDNPFDPEDEHRHRTVDESFFEGYEETDGNPSTFLTDTDFLLEHSSKHPNAPTKFQKIISLLLRLRARGIFFEPHEMLERIDESVVKVTDDDPNQFHGFRIVESQMLLSPDRDELYIRVPADQNAVLSFAERNALRFATNPYSYAGGGAMVYKTETEISLSHSVHKYRERYPDMPSLYCGRLDDNGETTDQPGVEPWGFRVGKPQRMRLLVRLLRQSWMYGGCGFPLVEMRKKGIVVRSFFPLHNQREIAKFGISRWASFTTMFSRRILKMPHTALVEYFGETVALYFIWIQEYATSLAPLGVLGVPIGILAQLNVDTDVVNAAFGLCIVVWAVYWNCHWDRKERIFSSTYAQDVEEEQEQVRDQFTPSRVVEVEPARLFDCRFEYPLTLRRRVDGALLELRYPERKRQLIRAFVTYPVVGLLTAIMLGAIGVVTWYRIKHTDDVYIRYGASIVTVVISAVFGQIFELGIDKLNALENNRTDDEEEAQYIYKSFFFYFCSSYFAMFALALWPGSEHSNEKRLAQMSAQMLTITVILPAVQNLQESALPWLGGKFRRRRDKLGGSACRAVCSLLCCRQVKSEEVTDQKELQAKELWLANAREPYDSPALDYLEITIQFGYMAMFAAVFPWGPLAAFLYNLVEIRVDANKILLYCQRPMAASCNSIGPWKNLFWFMTALSVISNAYLICILSDAADKLGIRDDHSSRYLSFTIVQYFLAVVGVIVYFAASGIPNIVRKMGAKQTLLKDRSIYDRMIVRLDHIRRQSTAYSENGTTALGISGTVQEDEEY